jgi:hypothetical protein
LLYISYVATREKTKISDEGRMMLLIAVGDNEVRRIKIKKGICVPCIPAWMHFFRWICGMNVYKSAKTMREDISNNKVEPRMKLNGMSINTKKEKERMK